MGLNQPGGKTKVVHGLLDKIGDNSNKKSKQFWLGKGNPSIPAQTIWENHLKSLSMHQWFFAKGITPKTPIQLKPDYVLLGNPSLQDYQDGPGRAWTPRTGFGRAKQIEKKVKTVRSIKKNTFHSDGSRTDGYFRTLDGYFRPFGRVGYSVQTKKILFEKKGTNHPHKT